MEKKILLLLLLLLVGAMAGPADVVQAENESTEGVCEIVCFGDSITKRGYPQILSKLLGVETCNAGVAGNTSREALKRIKKDVLSKHPLLVVIFFGTNDLRVDAPKKFVKLDEYERNLKQMIKACRSQNAEVVLCTLPPIESEAYFARHERKPYDELGGLEAMVQQYRNAATKVAKEAKTPLVDLNQLLKQQPNWCSGDGVHPGKDGCAVIAKQIGSVVEPLLKATAAPETSN